MKINSGQIVIIKNTNFNVSLKQLLLYDSNNLFCLCLICIYFCIVRGPERRMKDRMRDSDFIMNCTYLSLFFPIVLYISFHLSCLTLVSCFVCQSLATPLTFTHFSFSLSTPFSINLWLFFSHFFNSDVWWHLCLYIFFLLPFILFFFCALLAVFNCRMLFCHCLSAQTICFSIHLHFLFLCHLTYHSHPHLLLSAIPNLPSFFSFLVLHCFLLCSLLSTPMPRPAAVQEERQRNKEREGEVESTSAVNEEMPVEKILEAEMAVEQKTELHADGSSGGSSVSSLHSGNPLQFVFLCAFSHIQYYYQVKLENRTSPPCVFVEYIEIYNWLLIILIQQLQFNNLHRLLLVWLIWYLKK